MKFIQDNLLPNLQDATPTQLDSLQFGAIELDQDGNITQYNKYEQTLSGLSSNSVIGNNFFTQVAPCTNNYMVAQRFIDNDSLDETLDYVFTYKLKPTPVKLRLLKSDANQWICVQLK